MTLTAGANIDNGRALAVNGAVTMDTNRVSSLGCTNRPTAGMVDVGGRVRDSRGRGISRVLIIMTDGVGVVHTTYTTLFGYYTFTDIQVGNTFILEVKAKRYNFTQPTQVISLSGESRTVNFTAY